MKTVLYARVSTLDQTLEHQQEHAEKAGFKPDLVLADHGVSGIATRLRDRPEGKRIDVPPREMLLAPILPERSLAMFYAPRGIGKSWLGLSIGLAVASGSSLASLVRS